MRYYMILVRQYERDCDCEKKPWGCSLHAATAPLDKWEPWKAYGAHVASLYDRPPPKQSVNKAAHRPNFYPRNAAGYNTGEFITVPPADVRVVYFDTEDLLDMTWDAEAAYQQVEAKMLRVGEQAEELRLLSLSPAPVIAPPPKRRKRRTHVEG